MSIIGGPLELAVTFVLAARRFGFGRTAGLFLLLTPVYLYSLPPISCGCFPTFFRRCDRTRPYKSAMKSDLKNLASQQEIYFSDSDRYSGDPGDLMFVTSYGVRVTIHARDDAWAAVATHDALVQTEQCAIWYGEARLLDHELLEDAEPGRLVCS